MTALDRITVGLAQAMLPLARAETIEANLPLVIEALEEEELTTVEMGLMALATIRAEVSNFKPVEERVSKFNSSNKDKGHDFDLYDNRSALGNRGAPDGATFKGRGFIQLTGRTNYQKYGQALGTDLVGHPERALEPALAARILARYLKDHQDTLERAFRARDLRAARKVVNGGTHGLAEFEKAFRLGEDLLAPPRPSLRLFIRPPYVGTPDQSWTLVHGYGPDATSAASTFHTTAVFRTNGAGRVFAAAEGILCATPPFWWAVDSRNPIDSIPDALDQADVVTLYLCISPRVVAGPAFAARSAGMGTLLGFVYQGLDRASLENALGAQLDGLGLGRTITRAEAVRLLLAGELSVPVKAGDPIGQAAPTDGLTVPGFQREIGFAALVAAGPLDPSYAYDWMRAFVVDSQPDVDAFLTLSPARWPLIDPGMPWSDVVALARRQTFAWPALERLRAERNPSAADWRALGNAQKSVYRERLLARAGRAPAGSTEPPFEFNDRDARNVFQLEAVVEFYANFDDPWAAGAAPREPGNAGYVTVDLLPPAGSAATVSGKVVTLDGPPDLSGVRANANADGASDVLVLEGDTARISKMYRIVAIQGNTVTLDAAPTVTGSTAWRIKSRPVAVFIDPFGSRDARFRGITAAVQSPGVVRLDGKAKLHRINRRLIPSGTPPAANWTSGPFDTIYFPADVAPALPGRPARTYRIVSVDVATRVVTLDGNPDFGGGTSPWHLPAGLSGELPALDYALGPNAPDANPAVSSTKGSDHYDGVVIVVYDGQVAGTTRSSTFTSRNHAEGEQSLSSIRGNRRYNVVSFRSGKEFINYAYKVEDFGSRPVGGGEAGGGNDTVADARFYFGEGVTRDGDGKKTIRIHQGSRYSTGSGSEGCLVSPVFSELRTFLVVRHVDEWRALHPGQGLPRFAKLASVDHTQAKSIWNNTNASKPKPAIPTVRAEEWNGRMACTLWLVRPDERPEG